MHTIAVDVGYGRTKVVAAKKREIFPSHLVAYSNTGLGFLKKSNLVEVDGTKFYVGDDAGAEGSPRSLIGDTFHGSKEWKALLVYALFLFKDFLQDSEEYRLVLGLPFSQFDEQRRQSLKKAATELKFSVNNEDFKFSFAEVIVLPQGAGAIFEHLNEDDSTAIVDIGFYTLDLAYFFSGEFSVNRSTSVNYGVENLYKAIGKELTRLYNISYDVNRVEKVCRSGKLFYKGGEINLSDAIATHKHRYAEELLNRLHEHWADVLNDANRVVFIGGGAEIIRDILPSQANFFVPSEPSLANVLGFLKYGENL